MNVKPMVAPNNKMINSFELIILITHTAVT